MTKQARLNSFSHSTSLDQAIFLLHHRVSNLSISNFVKETEIEKEKEKEAQLCERDRDRERKRERGEKGSLSVLTPNISCVPCLSSLQRFRYNVNSWLVLLTLDALNICLQWPCWSFAPASELLMVVSQISPLYPGVTNRMGPMCPQGTFQGPSAMPSKTNMPEFATTTVCTSGLRPQLRTKNYRNTKEPHCLSAWSVRLRSTSSSRKHIPRSALLARYHHGS